MDLRHFPARRPQASPRSDGDSKRVLGWSGVADNDDGSTLLAMLSLTPVVRDEMIAHAFRGLPHEACGLFAAAVGTTVVEAFFPMVNVAESSEIYQLDSAEMMAVERQADDVGLQVLGVMHSHTHTTAYPSPTDVRDAAVFDPFGAWHYIIVSLKDAVPVLRSYTLHDGEITEESLVVAPVAG